MAFDQEEFRRQVAAQVTARIQALAKEAALRLRDPRIPRWFESLIRYRLREGLPDVSAPGIPEKIGIAEIGESDSDGQTQLMLSGIFEGRSTLGDMQTAQAFDDVVLVTKEDNAWTRGTWGANAHLYGSLADWPTGYYNVVDDNVCAGIHFQNCRLWTPCVSISDALWNPPRIQYSGMFSGEMRKVAQMLYGMGSSVPYRYCYSRTHGIFVASNGDRYVIEISTEDGITAWLLDTYPIQQYGTELDYTPVPEPTLPYLSQRIQLMNSMELDDYAIGGGEFGNMQPFFAECGWCFNADGHRAINVSWDFYTTGPLATDTTSNRSFVWEIEITEENDAPSGASISQTAPAFLYNKTHAQNSIKYPKYFAASGPCFQSYFQSYPSQQPPPNYSRAPVYAYYDVETDAKVVIYQRVDETESTIYDGRTSGDKYGCLQGKGHWAPYSNGSGSHRYGTDTFAGVVWYEFDGISRGISPLERYYTSRADDYSYTWTRRGDWITANVDGNSMMVAEHWDLVEDLVEHTVAYASRWEQLIIPFHERCAVYLLQVITDSGGSPLHRTVSQHVGGAYAQGQAYDHYIVAGASYRPYPPYDETNPCGCEFGTTIKFIGRWSLLSEPGGNVENRYVPAQGSNNGILLQAPGADPYRPDRLLACFDQGRGGSTTNDCLYLANWSQGNCAARTTETIVEQEASDPGHVKLNFYHAGATHVLMNEAYSTDHENLWKFIETPGQDGCFNMWASLDAFSGLGWISDDIDAPVSSKTYIGGADTYFPLDEINLEETGPFGIPYPEES